MDGGPPYYDRSQSRLENPAVTSSSTFWCIICSVFQHLDQEKSKKYIHPAHFQKKTSLVLGPFMKSKGVETRLPLNTITKFAAFQKFSQLNSLFSNFWGRPPKAILKETTRCAPSSAINGGITPPFSSYNPIYKARGYNPISNYIVTHLVERPAILKMFFLLQLRDVSSFVENSWWEMIPTMENHHLTGKRSVAWPSTSSVCPQIEVI